MTRFASGKPNILISALLAAIIAVGVGFGVSHIVTSARTHTDSTATHPGDRVRTAIAALRTSHLYVAPDAQDRLTSEQRKTIQAAATAADPQVFITVWSPSDYDGFYIDADAADQIAAGVARKGVYLVAGDRTHGADAQYGIGRAFTSTQLTGEFPKALLRYIDQVDGSGHDDDSSEEFDYWGGAGGGLAAGALMALVAYAALLIGVGIVRLCAHRTFLAPASWFPRFLTDSAQQVPVTTQHTARKRARRKTAGRRRSGRRGGH